MARRGVEVTGTEKRPDIVALANAGIPHFSEHGLAPALKEVVAKGLFNATTSLDNHAPADIYVITVGTPLVPGQTVPRTDMIEQASGQVAGHFADGATIILRSTVQVGTTRNIVLPILQATGKRFNLAMCPERTLEGDALRELTSLPQIVGGMDDEASDRAVALFSRLTHTTVRVADPETAEMIKLVDNTSRDVHFAFANEVARACDALGINGIDVIRFGKLGYPRTNVAMPGLVGGPCLEKDPHILLASLASSGIDLEITRAARMVNERQPWETVASLLALMAKRALPPPYTIAIAGMAFKGVPETDDLRGAMSLKVVEALRRSPLVGELRVYDKVVSSDDLLKLNIGVVPCRSIMEAVTGAHALVIANNHPEFSAISLQQIASVMRPDHVVFDYWNNLASETPSALSGTYFTVGNQAGVH